jgi:glucose/arabinose dehydrogenase
MESTGCRAFAAALALGASACFGAIADTSHPDFSLTQVPLPAKYKVMGLDFLPDGRLVIATTEFMGGGEMPSTRNPRHKVLLVTGATSANPADVKVDEIANAWYQPAGVVVANGGLYVSDRDGFYEIPRLSPPADLTQNRRLIVAWPDEDKWNPWGRQWHQWVFTPMFKDGYFYAPYSGSIRHGGPSDVNPTTSKSGAFLKWDLAGNLEAWAGGLRSPNGANIDDATGEMFVADNEGSWLPSSTFMLMKAGRFYGHRNVSSAATAATTPNWAENLPYEPPVAWLPHKEVRASPSQPIVLKEGAFAGDWILGDINHGGLVRIGLDRVGPTPNGTVFWFSKGTRNAAINRMARGPDGAVYIGTFTLIGGNWPSNTDMQPLYRLAAKPGAPTAFEMKAVRSLNDGLEIEFTLPVDPATVNPAAFNGSYQQEYRRMEVYGEGEQIKQALSILATEVSSDGMRVRLEIDGLSADRVVYLKTAATLRGADGRTAWNNEAWMTLNHVSTRAWDPALGIRGNASAPRPRDGMMRLRMAGPGILAVELASEGAWTARLFSADGRMSAVKSGRGPSRFELGPGESRPGLHVLRVALEGGEVIRKVVF